jgi:hypothetical protein
VPGESVGKDPEQSAIAQARVRGCVDRAQKRLNFTFNKCRRFSFGPRKSLGLDFPGWIHDVGGHRDGLDVFEVLIPGALSPGQELLDRAVIGGSCVSVPDRDRKKLEELLPG